MSKTHYFYFKSLVLYKNKNFIVDMPTIICYCLFSWYANYTMKEDINMNTNDKIEIMKRLGKTSRN